METDLKTYQLSMEKEWDKILRCIYNLTILRSNNLPYTLNETEGVVCYKKVSNYYEVIDKLTKLDKQAREVRLFMIWEIPRKTPPCD